MFEFGYDLTLIFCMKKRCCDEESSRWPFFVSDSNPRCLIFFHPGKNSMLTRSIFILPDSERIRESVCACANLFVDEEMSDVQKSNRGRAKKKLQLKHKNSLFSLQTFHYNYY